MSGRSQGQQPDGPTPGQKRRPRGILPPELIELVTPALKVGAATGGVGAAAGLATGIIRDAHLLLFSLAAGGQCFVLGSTFWVSRSTITRSWAGQAGDTTLNKRDMVMASSMAGGISGLAGGLLRGPRNIVPAMFMFSLSGALGQAAVDKYEGWQRPTAAPKEKNKEGDAGWLSKWNPMKRLTDQEYIDTMRRRIAQTELEIAALDDRIAEARASLEQPGMEHPRDRGAGPEGSNSAKNR